MTRESKYASCLNDLDYMQQQMIYAAHKHVLAQAESTIVSLEAETTAQRALIEQQAKEIARLREQGKKFAASFLYKMNKYGQWEDGCFYYNRTCASELQEVIDMAKNVLKEEHP